MQQLKLLSSKTIFDWVTADKYYENWNSIKKIKALSTAISKPIETFKEIAWNTQKINKCH